MFERERKSRAHYETRARWYDWANKLAAFLRGASATRERRKPVRRLGLKPGEHVLEVSVGTGTNLPLIAECSPAVRIVGLDISRGMLGVCQRKIRDVVAADLVEGEAAHLPFADGAFDAVLHHGGFAEFGDKQGALAEMMRVVKPGRKVVVCDAGVPEDGRISLVNRLILLTQPEYNQHPPLGLLPAGAQDVQLSWYFRDAWYMIEFTRPE